MRPRPRQRLRDPRASALIPGVANRDAREVCDRRIRQLQELLATGDDAAIDRALGEAVLLRIWRGRSLTSLAAMAENLLGLEEATARERASTGCIALGLEALSDEAIALWIRAEIALAEAGLMASLSATNEPESLRLELPIETAARGLAAIGRKVGPLARDQDEASSRERRGRPRSPND